MDILTIIIIGCMVVWTLSGAAHAYAAYEEARYQRIVSDVNAAAAEYLRTHDSLPEGSDFHLTLK